MERLEFGEEFEYNAIESAIHLTRYSLAKNLCKDKKVLDIACGEGYGSYLMSTWGARSIEAVDISPEAINKASKQFAAENINFVCHQAQQLEYQDSTFDLIVSLETIEHLDNPENFLKEIKRVLKPDGTLILSCPNDEYFIKVGGASENPYHKRKYSFDEFSNLAEGFFGGNCDYYLGYATGGFINLPISSCSGRSNFNTRNPFQMFWYKEGKNYFELPTHYDLNIENCSYYVGIWGRNSSISENAVFYAKDQCNQQYGVEMMNIKQKYDELKVKYNELQTTGNRNLEVLEELDKRNIEIDRLKMALQLSDKEKNIVQNNMCTNWEDAHKYRYELERIYKSRTFRYMSIVYKFRDSMHRLFKR